MTHLDLVITAIALSCDAFAAALTCGIKLKTFQLKNYLKIASAFGAFQAFMPLIGFFIASFTFKEQLAPFSKWIQAIVFLFLGLKSFKEAYESRKGDDAFEHCTCSNKLCLGGLSIATSIDALLIGLVLALFPTNIYVSVTLIGVITFVFSFLACLLGHYSSSLLKKWSPLLAGALLVALSIKSLC